MLNTNYNQHVSYIPTQQNAYLQAGEGSEENFGGALAQTNAQNVGENGDGENVEFFGKIVPIVELENVAKYILIQQGVSDDNLDKSATDFVAELLQSLKENPSDEKIYQNYFDKSGDEIVAHFGLTMHKAGLDDVADSMITTAQEIGEADLLRFSLLRQQFLAHLESLQQETGIELDDEDFQEMLASIPSQGLFHGLGKEGILEQLNQLFENPAKSDDAARQLRNERFAQSMLDAIRKGLA
ncbi:MAG: hypothetical protein K2N12_04440 [Helicobacter sp.]|nr:hypothetical protein [Helicobacter sp.]